MEEVSFRSGTAAVGGLVTAAGAAITLAVVLGGPGDAVASAPASRAPALSTVAPSAGPVPGSTPAARPFDRRWTPGRWDLWGQPGWRGWPRPPAPWPWGLWPRHRHR